MLNRKEQDFLNTPSVCPADSGWLALQQENVEDTLSLAKGQFFRLETCGIFVQQVSQVRGRTVDHRDCREHS